MDIVAVSEWRMGRYVGVSVEALGKPDYLLGLALYVLAISMSSAIRAEIPRRMLSICGNSVKSATRVFHLRTLLNKLTNRVESRLLR